MPYTKTCEQCGDEFEYSRWDAKFCGKICKQKHNNRRARRGAVVYDLAMKWRKERGKDDLSNLCHQLTLFIQSDEEHGRTSYNSHTRPHYHIPKRPMKKEGEDK